MARPKLPTAEKMVMVGVRFYPAELERLASRKPAAMGWSAYLRSVVLRATKTKEVKR